MKLIIFLAEMRCRILSSNWKVKLKLVCFVALVDGISFQYWFQTGKEDRKLKRGEVLGFLTWTSVEIKTKERSDSTVVVTDHLLMTCWGWSLFPWFHSDLICEIWVAGWDLRLKKAQFFSCLLLTSSAGHKVWCFLWPGYQHSSLWHAISWSHNEIYSLKLRFT